MALFSQDQESLKQYTNISAYQGFVGERVFGITDLFGISQH